VGRLYFILGLLLFLFVGYWFIAHAFVIVPLISVFGLMAVVAAAIIAFVYLRRIL
jgi:hypothetical protein